MRNYVLFFFLFDLCKNKMLLEFFSLSLRMENPGVMSNPTLEKLHEGVKIARENNVDMIPGITICYPADCINSKSENITEILKENM